jgi:hypothetical protein
MLVVLLWIPFSCNSIQFNSVQLSSTQSHPSTEERRGEERQIIQTYIIYVAPG